MSESLVEPSIVPVIEPTVEPKVEENKKPKRKLTEKQLAALEKGRGKRVKTDSNQPKTNYINYFKPIIPVIILFTLGIKYGLDFRRIAPIFTKQYRGEIITTPTQEKKETSKKEYLIIGLPSTFTGGTPS